MVVCLSFLLVKQNEGEHKKYIESRELRPKLKWSSLSQAERPNPYLLKKVGVTCD